MLIVQADDGFKCALKTLRADLDIDWSSLAAEATKLSNLPLHPHVIPIIGFACYDGPPFIILPAMNSNLRTVRQDPVTPDTAAVVLGQVAAGLGHLHKCGVLHLDLKPENILVAENNRLVISDFGLSAWLPIAQDLGALPEHVRSTLTGTVPYMSPEHFARGPLTPKTDIFALGVILFELLTGRHPFEATARSSTATTISAGPRPDPFTQIAWRIMYEVPSFTDLERSQIPGSLRAVCSACLEVNASNRPRADEITATIGYKEEYAPEDETIIGGNVNRANTLWQLGRVEEAQRLVQECLAENPFYLPALIAAAEIAFGKGDVQSALDITERAVAIGARKSAPPRELGTLLVNLANYYLSTDNEEALRVARLARTMDPEDWQALGNVATACLNLAQKEGQAQKRQDLLDEGWAAIEEALKRAPRDLKLLITQGLILVAKGELQPLRSFLTETTWPPSAVTPGGGVDPNVGYVLIRVYIGLGELDEAEKLLAPMRVHAALQPLVKAAEREMVKRKRELGIT